MSDGRVGRSGMLMIVAIGSVVMLSLALLPSAATLWSERLTLSVDFSIATANSSFRLQANDRTLSTSTTRTGNIDTNRGSTDTFTSASPVTTASNVRDWTLNLVWRDRPNATSSYTIAIWWQSNSCTSPIAGQVFAQGTITVPPVTNLLGTTHVIPRVAGTVAHSFGPNDKLCMSFQNPGTTLANDARYVANTVSTSGVTGIYSSLEGPFTQ